MRLAWTCMFLSCVCVVGCTRTINQYRVVDIQSRREYTAVGSPTFLNGGAISFPDRDSGKLIVLQNYELSGMQGEQLTVRQNPFTQQYEVVKAPPRK